MLSIYLLDTNSSLISLPDCWQNGLLPEQQERLSQFASTKRRREYIHSRLLINHVLSYYYPEIELSLYREGHTGPILQNGRIVLSLSHSHGLIALAIMSKTGVKEDSIGVDIECCQPRNNLNELAQYFMLEEELEGFLASSEQEALSTFYRMWTRKEALYKSFPLQQQQACSISTISTLCPEKYQRLIQSQALIGQQYYLSLSTSKPMRQEIVYFVLNSIDGSLTELDEASFIRSRKQTS